MATKEFQDALIAFIRALDVVHGYWSRPSSMPNADCDPVAAHEDAETARATIKSLSAQFGRQAVAPRGMDAVQFVTSIRDDVEDVWHLCRFVYCIEADRTEEAPDFERLRNEMLNRLPALRNQLWESWRHIEHAFELQNAIADPAKHLSIDSPEDENATFEKRVIDAGPLDKESGDWIQAKRENKDFFGVLIKTLGKYRRVSMGGWVGGDGWYGVDRNGRIWRKPDGYKDHKKAPTYYYVPSLPNSGE